MRQTRPTFYAVANAFGPVTRAGWGATLALEIEPQRPDLSRYFYYKLQMGNCMPTPGQRFTDAIRAACQRLTELEFYAGRVRIWEAYDRHQPDAPDRFALTGLLDPERFAELDWQTAPD